MKKFVALLLAVLLVMVNIAALAGPTDDAVKDNNAKGNTRATTTGPSITKKYTTTGTANNVYPTEELKFTVTPKDSSYPTVTVGTANKFSVDGTSDTYTIPVNVPDVGTTDGTYKTAGRYHYEVVETGATTTSQAVGYDTTTKFNVDVYVYYDLVNGVKTLVKEVVIYSGDEKTTGIASTAKADNYKNTYSVGELKVTKAITGNLADPNKAFTIKVTLQSTNNVASDITIDSTHASSLVSGDGNKNWTDNKKEIVFTAKGDEYITISNIPTGVTYTIEETGVDKLANDDAATQMTNVNNDNAYYVTGEVTTAKSIGTSTASETITNKKTITVPTGITLETLPYVLIMAIAAFGAVALFARKREEY